MFILLHIYPPVSTKQL